MAKKVIDRIVYNTETAEIIHEWENMCSKSDFGFTAETLYKTKKGNFFVCGESGPMGKYAVSLGNNSTGGSSGNITPISEDQAIDWLERHDGDEKLLELFPDEIEEG